jgi:hypothetical protein
MPGLVAFVIRIAACSSKLLYVVMLIAIAGGAVASGRQGAGANARPGAPEQTAGSSVIVGRVVDLEGRPVSLPIVNIIGTTSAGRVFQRTLADEDGRFVLRQLTAGSYEFSVQARGFLPGSGLDQRRALGPGRSLDLTGSNLLQNVTLRVWPLSSIEGTVTDEYGDPIAGAEVWVIRRQALATPGRLVPAQSRRADDRGVYRAWRLGPGEYIVAVRSVQTVAPASGAGGIEVPSGSGGPSADPTSAGQLATPTYRVGDSAWTPTQALIGPPPTPDGRVAAYPTSFYPNATSVTEARPVVLGAGEHRTGVNIQTRLLPAFRVEGSLLSPDGAPPAVDLHLVPAGVTDSAIEEHFPAATARLAPDGRFTFLGVPAGSYVLQVTVEPRPTPVGPGARPQPAGSVPSEPVFWARVPVAVTDGDVTGLAVQLREGPRVTGRLVFDGTSVPRELPQLTLWLENQVGRRIPLGVTEGGAILSPSLVPGQYLVGGESQGDWTLKAATVAYQDISDRPLAIDDDDVTDLVVTLTDRPNRLDGVVRSPSGGPDVDALVILVPRDRERWDQRGGRSMRSVRVAADGSYALTGVPPGDYLLAAVDDETGAGWPTPSWIERATGLATSVTIGPDERKAVDLRTTVLLEVR